MRLVEVHIEVEDVERSKQLYSRLLPHKKIAEWGDGNVAAFVLENGSAFGCWKKGHMGIHNGQGGANVHFAFQIESEEYEDYKTRIQQSGLEVLEHQWETGHKSLYFFDYDGNQGEFITTDWITLRGLS